MHSNEPEYWDDGSPEFENWYRRRLDYDPTWDPYLDERDTLAPVESTDDNADEYRRIVMNVDDIDRAFDGLDW